MRFVLLLAGLVAAVYGSNLEILSAPSSVELPNAATDLKTSQLSPLNAYLLGLSARPVEGFPVKTDLFSRPRALAVVRVEGVDSVFDSPSKTYTITNDGFESVGLDQDLSLVFGSDRQLVQLTAGGITGSELAQTAQQQTVDTSVIKTKIPQLLKELEAVYQLTAAVKALGTKIDNSADVYRVTIGGLASASGLSDAEKQTALNDIQTAIEALNSALATVYGNQALVEVVAVSSAIQEAEAPASSDVHKIAKRDATTEDPLITNLKKLRNSLQVYSFTSGDYPAIFAIFLGLILVLVLGLIYIVVGMLSMDPGKDSIIYRMTTTRMKKD